MAYATYGGIALFGTAAAVQPSPEDRARQVNTYPGVNGVESLDLGSRGATTRVEGLWIFASAFEMAACLATWRAMMDGTPRTFVDTLGQAWPAVILGPYQLAGRRSTSAVTGYVYQRFSGTLHHLVLP